MQLHLARTWDIHIEGGPGDGGGTMASFLRNIERNSIPDLRNVLSIQEMRTAPTSRVRLYTVFIPDKKGKKLGRMSASLPFGDLFIKAAFPREDNLLAWLVNSTGQHQTVEISPEGNIRWHEIAKARQELPTEIRSDFHYLTFVVRNSEQDNIVLFDIRRQMHGSCAYWNFTKDI